ncbi:hypothetical protein SAMN05192544_1001280 [Paraburkholderia hospita]|uniref:Rad50/SbcC-type AAA domain-containing protein n=2 Tax=Paraburkholderia hospita TaxID=169430 RepID=A0AAN1J4F3_9BURK|nr:hypothetical protein [Paraburkholderia hospita]AUT67021.1 hypothetical protein C2L64_00690 [Paraburkholderia hospita]SEH40862.1 hypothetical protein SAMN05192544_1001280 [Paraburkholderia hospita]
MKSLRFVKLSLLSESEMKARTIQFGETKTVLVGGNHTGKSTALRHLFAVFGCETRSMGKVWDSQTHAAVDFELEDHQYRMLRAGDLFALFTAGELLWATRSKGALRDKLSELFDFVLPLTTKSEGVKLARPSLFFLPFFIDQDGSWDAGWNTFLRLNEFQLWQKPTIELALDIRSSAYWKAFSELSEERRAGEALAQEHSVLKKARENLSELFPRKPWFVDGIAFRRELRELESQASDLSERQDKLRAELTEVTTARDVLITQLSLLEEALRDHQQDMVFLDEHSTENELVCPTCGTHHAASFHQRLELDAEADDLRQVRARMKVSLRREEKRLEDLARALLVVDSKAAELDKLLAEQKGSMSLREIVNRAGTERAHFAFESQEARLNESIGANVGQQRLLEMQLASLSDAKRAKSIRATFNALYAQFARELEVPPSLQSRRGEVNARPKEGGSGGPRAILAYYFALSHTAARFANGYIPPLVIDSPHPKAQDELNRPLVTKFILRNAVEGQQVIVGLEEPPPEDVSLKGSGEQRVDLTEKFKLLREEQYNNVGRWLFPQILKAQQARKLEAP